MEERRSGRGKAGWDGDPGQRSEGCYNRELCIQALVCLLLQKHAVLYQVLNKTSVCGMERDAELCPHCPEMAAPNKAAVVRREPERCRSSP